MQGPYFKDIVNILENNPDNLMTLQDEHQYLTRKKHSILESDSFLIPKSVGDIGILNIKYVT
jgi:hypothetical protein